MTGKGKIVPSAEPEACFRYRKQARKVAGKGKTVPSAELEACFRYKKGVALWSIGRRTTPYYVIISNAYIIFFTGTSSI